MRINPNTLGNYVVPSDASSVAIDIGANVGNWFTAFGGQFDLVHAYEPLLRCFDICCDKASAMPSVHVFQQAVLDQPRVVRMMAHQRGTAGSSAVEGVPMRAGGWTGKRLGTTTSIDLATAVRRTGSEEIGYLKLDCECSEYPALIDADLSGVRYLGMELHWQLGQKKWARLVEKLEQTHRWHKPPVWKRGRHNELLGVRK